MDDQTLEQMMREFGDDPPEGWQDRVLAKIKEIENGSTESILESLREGWDVRIDGNFSDLAERAWTLSLRRPQSKTHVYRGDNLRTLAQRAWGGGADDIID